MKYIVNYKLRHDGKVYKAGDTTPDIELSASTIATGAVTAIEEAGSGEPKELAKMTVPELEAYAKENHDVDDLEATAKELLKVEKANKPELLACVVKLDADAE